MRLHIHARYVLRESAKGARTLQTCAPRGRRESPASSTPSTPPPPRAKKIQLTEIILKQQHPTGECPSGLAGCLVRFPTFQESRFPGISGGLSLWPVGACLARHPKVSRFIRRGNKYAHLCVLELGSKQMTCTPRAHPGISRPGHLAGCTSPIPRTCSAPE